MPSRPPGSEYQTVLEVPVKTHTAARLQEIAHEESTTYERWVRSDFAREAIKEFVENYDSEQDEPTLEDEEE